MISVTVMTVITNIMRHGDKHDEHDKPVGELDGVDHALGPHHVRHVADGGAGGGAKVQHLERRKLDRWRSGGVEEWRGGGVEGWRAGVPTLLPGGMCILSTPPRMAAASLDRKGFHTLYSIWASRVRVGKIFRG